MLLKIHFNSNVFLLTFIYIIQDIIRVIKRIRDKSPGHKSPGDKSPSGPAIKAPTTIIIYL